MNDTSINSVAPPIKVAHAARVVSITLLLLAIVTLYGVNASSRLFPASSDTIYLLVTAIVSLLSLCCLRFSNRVQAHYAIAVSAVALLMLAAMQIFEPPKGDSAMLTSIWAQVFFLSRPVALGLAIAALVGYLFQTKRIDARLDSHCHLLSLLAGTAFLAGEIAGSYWAFIGWGRSWSWSGHFFFSALTYLLFILVFHLPKAWFPNARALAMGRAAVLGFISLLMLGYRVL
ncbi:hypothetical protein [Shewanella youngdeokensis]|uniref:Cytochrome c assembly protein domain-containing protein n=1 Tax=Shewanella youngdeokensis TaxID=2999068 RepID=A0ABZ0JWB5_9GAMM|nr:hypothetical protein RGE70_14885 [Shewanella sp. DAU334]